jgi:hypothetical protein
MTHFVGNCLDHIADITDYLRRSGQRARQNITHGLEVTEMGDTKGIAKWAAGLNRRERGRLLLERLMGKDPKQVVTILEGAQRRRAIQKALRAAHAPKGR